MDNLTFREYEENDIDYIARGLCNIEDTENETTTSLKLVDDFSDKIKNYVKEVNLQPSTLTIIAEIKGHACGFIIGIVEPQNNPFTRYSMHGLIQAIWVERKYNKQGIGTALVNELLASFSEFSVPYCDLAYHPDNSTAKAFWKKLGFNDSQIIARKFL